MTIREYLNEKKSVFSESTWKTAKSHLETNSDLFLLPVKDMVKNLLERYKRNTAKQVYIRLRCFLIKRNKDFKIFEQSNPGVWRFSYMSRDKIPMSEDIALLLNQSITDVNLWNAIILMSKAGLRWNELFSVRWVDFEVGTKIAWLNVYQGKGRKDRKIALSLETYQSFKDNMSEYIVNNSPNELRHKWITRLRNRFIPHSLRAYAITNWSRKTTNLKLVADQSGHTRIETLFRYIKWTSKEMEDLISHE